MPLASLFTTKKIQDILVHKVQNHIVDIFSTLGTAKMGFRFICWMTWYGIKTVYEIRKLPKPTISNVNKQNSKVLVELYEWFMAHEDPNDSRYLFYDALLRLIAQKNDWDNHMGRRLEAWLREWKKRADDGEWVDDGKNPETYWILNKQDKQEPTYKRQLALKDALHKGEWPKVLNLVD